MTNPDKGFEAEFVQRQELQAKNEKLRAELETSKELIANAIADESAPGHWLFMARRYAEKTALTEKENEQLRAELHAAVTALRRIGKIKIPDGCDDGTWAATTRYSNDQVTAFQVREASNIVTAYDAAHPEGKCPR